MPDPVSIIAGISALKNAVDIAKALRQADHSVATAELKLKIVELLGELIEAKTAMFETSELLKDKDAEIARLNEATRLKGDVVKVVDAIFLKSGDGKLGDGPMCLHCWSASSRLNPLIHLAANRRVYFCPACKTQYDNMAVSRNNFKATAATSPSAE
jgi:hypothetical protein